MSNRNGDILFYTCEIIKAKQAAERYNDTLKAGVDLDGKKLDAKDIFWISGAIEACNRRVSDLKEARRNHI
jgi:hypothetical protein